MKYLKILWGVCFFLFLAVGQLQACNDDYDAVPPFLPAPVSPNILMVVDRSGSMSWSAYNPTVDREDWCNTASGCGWSYTGTEEGYFEPTKNYHYPNGASGSEGDGGIWEEDTDTTDAVTTCPTRWSGVYGNTNTYTGACLNFHLMSRMDLLRWSMTGGRPDACTDGEYRSVDCDPAIQCTGTDCVIRTQYNDKVLVSTTRINEAIVPQYSDAEIRPRFGLLFYSNNLRAEKVYIGDYPASGSTEYDADSTRPFTYFSRLINAMSTDNATGTGPAMWEAYDYFKQSDDHVFLNDFEYAVYDNPGTKRVDPDEATFFKDPLQVCDYQRENCRLVPCAKNFVILATDGQWNVGGSSFQSTCTINTGYLNNSADPVVPAHKMHYDLLRQVTSASGVIYDKRVDSVFGLGLFLQGSGLLSLQNTAMYGGYDTLKGTDQWPGSLTAYPSGTCTMDDCGSGKGSGCTALPASSMDWDSDPIDGVPDTFVNASGGTEMRAAIKKLIDTATKKAAAGSSISVLSERATSGSILHQGLFYPTKAFNATYDVDWTGSLNAYWFFNTKTVNNIREDNANSLYLDTTRDNILDFIIDSSGTLSINYYDTTAAGAHDNLLGTYNSVEDIHKLFESGEKLRDRAADNRVIYGVGVDSAGADNMAEFTAANHTSFDSLLDTSSGQTGEWFDACLGSTAEARSENLINYTRGSADSFTGNTGVGDCRSRVINASGDRWKLGDIIHSSPTLVAYSDYSMLYVASNDGMLHAFQTGAIRKDGVAADQQVRLCEKDNADCFKAGNTVDSNDLGKESWAFIPKNVMPYLKYIADPDYQHIYTHDMAPYFIQHGGKKILVGGMRMGGATGCTSGGQACGTAAEQVVPPDFDPSSPAGAIGLSSYYALDVTDPDNPKFLWEFNHPDLGLTYSGPAYINRGGNSYVMFTSGPLNTRGETDAKATSPSKNQSFKAFILKVDSDFKLVDADNDGDVDADDVFKFDGEGRTGSGYVKDVELGSLNSAFGGRMFTNGYHINNGANTDLVFFGVNDANGTAGRVLALVPYDDLYFDVNNNGVADAGDTINFDPTNKFYAHGGDEEAIWLFNTAFQSTTSPVVTKIAFGECFDNPFIYFGTGRWFYKDDTPGINVNDTEKLYGVLIRDCVADLMDGKNCSINYANNSNDICKEVSSLSDESTMGWVVDELEGNNGTFYKERNTTDPTFAEGLDIIFFTTMQPSSDPCDFGGRSRIWALNCMSGDSVWGGCPNYKVDVPSGSLLLQLSGGNIEDADLDQTVFKNKTNKATDWMVGIPPESATPFVPYSGSLTGEIILWIER
jgi:type IV pilus assembly protein PilY1